ncbi:MAG TPA: hypothetical protein VHT31_07295, partial [Candidatus Acidoferrum sp.]|nr:hypothetical protein [Candidatus Acidoferrum sp.]
CCQLVVSHLEFLFTAKYASFAERFFANLFTEYEWGCIRNCAECVARRGCIGGKRDHGQK